MVVSVNPSNVPHHKNPIPAAAVHRGVLISSSISGQDLVTSKYSSDKSTQIALAFEYLQNIVTDAGATAQDIIKVDMYFADKEDRKLVNPHWVLLFPDEQARPARQAHRSELPDGCCLQMVITAIIGDHLNVD